jgi:gamma-glutamyltranspeptidase/glutathione hydrolase
MKGAVAAGHPLTAEAGARILEEGGNAVDACVAAAFVGWVAESPLTGPGAGGFMLVHRARDRRIVLLDFFVAVPGQGLPPGGAAMEHVDVRFDRRTTQTFLIGPASCAVPGFVAGLADAHRLYGRLPWPVLVAPAVELARAGVALDPPRAYLHAILDPVLRRDGEGRAIYGRSRPLGAGDRVKMRDLATTLEGLAAEGAEGFYRGELARCISGHVLEGGGRITESDLAAYRVVRRRPVRAAFRGCDFVSNAPPSAGGLLIAFALRVLDRLGPVQKLGSDDAVAALAEVMRESARARAGSFVRELRRGGAAKRLLADGCVEEAARRARSALRGSVPEPLGLPSTTHVSVLDGAGNAASLSSSLGCGSGVIVPGTGIHLNNMLGELDVNPGGETGSPGARLSSMMSPSLLIEGGRPRLVLGSAGSERLRGAILQIVVNVIDHGLGVAEAIDAPRLHLDGDVLHLEGGIDPDVVDRLLERGYELVRWSDRNLFFGGVAAVALEDGGVLEAAGDPRRGGAGVVVR